MASYMPALLYGIIRMLLFLLILFLNSSEGKDFSVGLVFSVMSNIYEPASILKLELTLKVMSHWD